MRHLQTSRNRGDASSTILVAMGILFAIAVLVGVGGFFFFGVSHSSTAPAAPSVMVSPAPVAPVAARPIELGRTFEPAADTIQLVGEPYIVPAGRSPIPQPGETILDLIPAPRLDGLHAGDGAISPPPLTEGQVIPWHEAISHVGRVVTVEGKIVRSHNTGKVCFLNFVPDHPSDAFYLIVFEQLLDFWPEPPDEYFLEKTVRATGQVFMHRGKPQIRIENASQIKIVK
jgi:hypothetical protein